jgi:hypothetical protein
MRQHCINVLHTDQIGRAMAGLNLTCPMKGHDRNDALKVIRALLTKNGWGTGEADLGELWSTMWTDFDPFNHKRRKFICPFVDDEAERGVTSFVDEHSSLPLDVQVEANMGSIGLQQLVDKACDLKWCRIESVGSVVTSLMGPMPDLLMYRVNRFTLIDAENGASRMVRLATRVLLPMNGQVHVTGLISKGRIIQQRYAVTSCALYTLSKNFDTPPETIIAPTKNGHYSTLLVRSDEKNDLVVTDHCVFLTNRTTWHEGHQLSGHIDYVMLEKVGDPEVVGAWEFPMQARNPVPWPIGLLFWVSMEACITTTPDTEIPIEIPLWRSDCWDNCWILVAQPKGKNGKWTIKWCARTSVAHGFFYDMIPLGADVDWCNDHDIDDCEPGLIPQLLPASLVQEMHSAISNKLTSIRSSV